MTFTQMRDILTHIQHVHSEAARCCQQSRPTADQRITFLLHSFQQWNQRLGDLLARLQQEQQEPLLSTWVQFPLTGNVDQALADLLSVPLDDSPVAAEKSYVLQAEIVALLRQLSENAPPPEVRPLLLEVADFELQAAKELGKAEVTQRDV